MKKTIRTGAVMSGPGAVVPSNVTTNVSTGGGGRRRAQPGGAPPIPSLRGRAPGVNMPSLGGPRSSTTAIPVGGLASRVGVMLGRSATGGINPGGIGPSFNAPGGGAAAARGSRVGIWSAAGVQSLGARQPAGPSAAIPLHREPAGTAMPTGASKIAAPGTSIPAAPGAPSGSSHLGPKKKQTAKTR